MTKKEQTFMVIYMPLEILPLSAHNHLPLIFKGFRFQNICFLKNLMPKSNTQTRLTSKCLSSLGLKVNNLTVLTLCLCGADFHLFVQGLFVVGNSVAWTDDKLVKTNLCVYVTEVKCFLFAFWVKGQSCLSGQEIAPTTGS